AGGSRNPKSTARRPVCCWKPGLTRTDDRCMTDRFQHDARGRLRHLLTLDGLDAQQITALLDRAQTFVTRPGEPLRSSEILRGHTVANLFFETSTRTRTSFELAARRLGADVINLDINVSSAAK